MTAIVISEGIGGTSLVRALERGTGCASMDDAGLIADVTAGHMGRSRLLSWALFGAHPWGGRVMMGRKYGTARVRKALISALGRGVRIFYGDLGHLLESFPVAVFRVHISGNSRRRRQRRRLFGMDAENHRLYDLYLPGGADSEAIAARAILERSALALGDIGRPLPTDRLGLAVDIADAELDLIHRGVDVDFWDPCGELTVWNHSRLDNGALAALIQRLYAFGTLSCRRGTPPPLFASRVSYTVRMRIEGEARFSETMASVASRNGALSEVILRGGLDWGGRLVVELPEALSDPEEVMWRLMALYPGRTLVVPAPRYAWLVSRMGLF